MQIKLKLLRMCLSMLLCFAALLPLQAAEEMLKFESTQQQALFRELTAELRCPKCQNQNIADSNAVVAVDMRNKTYQLVQEGQSKQQVLDYMKQRYGDFVHYQPPLQWSTIWLWLLPAALLGGLFFYMFRKSGHGTTVVVQDQPLAAELQAIIDEVSTSSSVSQRGTQQDRSKQA